MKCEFEEKQFEQQLNIQLLYGRNLLYVPGQVLENTLGFDSALFTKNRYLWKLFAHNYRYLPIVNKPKGLIIDPNWWGTLNDKIEYFPKFKFNVFIQHKRPEYLHSHNSSEWKSWKEPYYRFYLTNHQQQALELLENNISDKGIVVYASPSFISYSKLWETIENFNLVETTNFVQPSKLHAHTCYTYTSPGNNGKGHSEEKSIESYNITTKLNSLFEKGTTGSNKMFILELGEIINSVLLENSFYRELYKDMMQYLSSDLKNIDIATPLIRISVFNFLIKVRWVVGFSS